MSETLPIPPGPRAGRRQLTRLAAALAGVLVVLAVALVMAATWRTVRAADAARDRTLARTRVWFEAVPLLTDAETAMLRRSLNAVHVERARALGVPPPATRAARDSAASSLVDVSGRDAFVFAPARYSVAALTPDGAAAIDSLAVAFNRATAAALLPSARPTVTSVFRSAEDQSGLRSVNANAAGGTSSHEYATTFDLAYRRYEAVPPPRPAGPWARGTPAPVRRAVDAALDARWSEAVARVAADYPSRYDALLGRALIALEDRGVLVVVRERRQPVYHVTVARRLAGDAP